MPGPRHHRRRRIFRSGHAWDDIRSLLSEVEPKGLCLDLPAGNGVNIPGIRQAGFEPVAADLYPERVRATDVRRVKADFGRTLPFGDGAFAAVLCSEGIEHCAAQTMLISEFARVLHPGGTLMITTPNVLNLRARLAYLLTGHYSLSRAPVTEVTQLWAGGGRSYVGHVHVVGYFALRFMLRHTGLAVRRVTTAKYSPSAVCLAPLLWLPVRLATARLLKPRLREHPGVYREIMAHALSADVLFGKKLIILAQKTGSCF